MNPKIFTVRITNRGRVTLPKEIRQAQKPNPGIGSNSSSMGMIAVLLIGDRPLNTDEMEI